MPEMFDLHAIAHQVQAAQDEVRPIAPITSRFDDFDVASGYAVAELIHRARIRGGASPVGRKIGFTNPAMWSRYGVHDPIWAHIYDTTVVHIDAAEECSIGRFIEPRIEPEIVVHFRSAPPMGRDLLAILASVDWIAHGFEIVQSHFPGWHFRAADAVADSGLHGTLLVGAPQSLEALGNDLIVSLERFTIALSCDGTRRAEGRGSNVLGSPLAAIAHLIGLLAAQSRYAPLQAGDIVTTGTITDAQSIHAGENWRTELQGILLPGLSVEFIA